MTSPQRAVAKAARFVVNAFTGSGLSQKTGGTAQGQANLAPGLSALCRQAAAEACVLLENDGTLPLSPTNEVSVFGRCQLDWFYVGYGSGGDVHAPYLVSLMQGLADAGVAYNRVLAEVYRAWSKDPAHRVDPGWWGHWPLSHPEMPVSHELAQAAAYSCETALVVIGRAAGEERDNRLMPGGYYLSAEEHALLDMVTSAFEHTVVVLNVGNVIDLSWRAAYGSKISAVLVAWLGGMEAGHAVTDVLYGKVNPCGRLADTIAHRYEDYPSSTSFGRQHRTSYDEGIFVGYRGLGVRSSAHVLYPFGHGLSYTEFALVPSEVAHAGTELRLEVQVTNVGLRDGRETVLVWCEAPRGTLDKPERVLVAFAKTGLLAPGERERLRLVWTYRDLASFDESAHSLVCEEGLYRFWANQLSAGSITLRDRLVVETCTPPCATSSDLRSRMVQGLPQEVPTSCGQRRDAVGNVSQECDVTFADVARGDASLDAFISQLSDNELKALTHGEGSMNSALGPKGNAGAFAGITPSLRARGVPPIVCVDGPAGIRLAQHHTLLPSACALACTWDVDLVRKLYALVGEELGTTGADVLLAPGMNLHRNPLCGRNFEYFSEDPLLTGRMAASVVRGLHDAGRSACPKHFACNNQERNRNHNDSCLSERALREIYLRGFEICVREAAPALIMTSYNKVNGVWAHYNYELVTSILRGEWGFEGAVITDWWMQRARSPEFPGLRDNGYRVRAGVDVLMPGGLLRTGRGFRVDGVSHAELQRTARHVLGFVLRHMRRSQQ